MLNNYTGYDLHIDPDNGARQILNCQSIEALAAYHDSCKTHKGCDETGSIDADSRDCDGFSYGQALKLAKDGGIWESGASEFAKIEIPQAVTQRPKPRRKLANNMVGFLPNVGAHLAGQPIAMLNLPTVPVQAKVIKVGVHVGRVWGTKQNQVWNRAAAIIAVVDELVLQGYAVEVWAVWRNEGSDVKVEVNTLIKSTIAPWQPSTVAFALGNLAFQRRLCWGAAERMSVGHRIAGGYGNGNSCKRDDLDVFYPYVSNGRKFDTPEKAYKEIKKITDKEIKASNNSLPV